VLRTIGNDSQSLAVGILRGQPMLVVLEPIILVCLGTIVDLLVVHIGVFHRLRLRQCVLGVQAVVVVNGGAGQ
jgi:hypothetical protein